MADIKAIITDLEDKAAATLAAYHRLEGALDTWHGIQQAMIKVALVERAEKKEASHVG